MVLRAVLPIQSLVSAEACMYRKEGGKSADITGLPYYCCQTAEAVEVSSQTTRRMLVVDGIEESMSRGTMVRIFIANNVGDLSRICPKPVQTPLQINERVLQVAPTTSRY